MMLFLIILACCITLVVASCGFFGEDTVEVYLVQDITCPTDLTYEGIDAALGCLPIGDTFENPIQLTNTICCFKINDIQGGYQDARCDITGFCNETLCSNPCYVALNPGICTSPPPVAIASPPPVTIASPPPVTIASPPPPTSKGHNIAFSCSITMCVIVLLLNILYLIS